ncbi:MAG: TonB-dependent receptor plug domain-containing protein [Bacteroidaceae bacterium]
MMAASLRNVFAVGFFVLFPFALEARIDIDIDTLASPNDRVLGQAAVKARRVAESVKSVAPIQKLSAKMFEQQGIVDLSDALKRFAGVTLRDYGGAGGLKTVSVRGLGAAHTGVSYDGLNLSDCQRGQIDLSRFTLDGVSSISLVSCDDSNIFTTARSAASSSQVNIQTRGVEHTDLNPHLNLQLKQGSYGLINPMLRYEQRLSAKFAVVTQGDYLYAENNYPFTLYNGPLTSREKRDNSRINKVNGEMNTYFTPNARVDWTTKLYYYDNSRQLPGMVQYYNPDCRQKLHDRTAFLQSRLKYKVAEQLSFLFHAKYNWSESCFSDPRDIMPHQNYWQREAYGSAAAEYRLPHLFSENGEARISYAADYIYNSLNSNLQTQPSVWQHSVLQQLAATYSLPRFKATARAIGSLYFSGAAQGESAKRQRRLSPSLSASYKLLNTVPFYFRAYYKEIFRVPTFTESYYYHMGSTLLKPERTKQIGAGLTLDTRVGSWLPQLTLTFDAYHNRVRDKIMSIPINLNLWRTLNLDDVDAFGIDATLNACIRLAEQHSLVVASNYTYQQVENKTKLSKTYDGLQIAYTPKHTVGASIAWENPWLNLSLAATAVSERFSTNEHYETTQMKGYADCSASIYRNFTLKKTSLNLRFDLRNLFDKQYEVIRRYPMPGRSYHVTLMVTI